MTDFIEYYAQYFPVGMKVNVGIPTGHSDVFRDWAVIHELDEDFVSLQLSRDQLPVNVSLKVGQILELRGGSEGNGYCCRGIIVMEGRAREILLRLIGEIVSDELREFYRIDAFLPIKYYISRQQNPDLLQKEWEIRRSSRQENEQARKAKRWDSTFMTGRGELPTERHQDNMDDDSGEEWDTIIPLAANISGGGLRVITHQGFENGEYVLLEILVPTPRRIIDAVVRVIFATPNHAAGDNHEYYNTAFHFVFIDERDRDAIVNHISNVQLKRIKQLREKYIYRGDNEDENVSPGGIDWITILKRIAISVLFLTLLTGLILYFKDYAENKPKNEIEEMFEMGLKKYIEKIKKNN